MTLPTCSIKECAKYQIDEQSRSLCVQKPGTAVDPSDENQITCVALKNPESYKYNFIRSETINK